MHWGTQLMGERHKEALESLLPEKVTKEVVFTFSLEGKTYAAFYVEGEALRADMSLSVNQDHQRVKNAVFLDKRVKADLCYDLELPKELL